MYKFFDFLHHFFIPREENNFRARALHIDFLTYYLLIGLLFAFVFKYSDFSNILGFATDITVEKLYQLTNYQREKNGLPPLALNEKLSQAAFKKAQDMFAKNYWAHYAPDGTTPWNFILDANYQYEYAGENLAKNFLFSDGVVQAWINSPTHKANILNKEYTDVGFAVVNGVLNGEETTLVVQMFGKPLGSKTKTIATSQKNIQEPTQEKIPSSETLTNQKTILAKQSVKPKVNFIWFSFNIDIFFIIFLLFALGLDFYFAEKMGIIRISGKNLAHFIFISFFLLALFTLTKGKIL